MTYRIPLPSVTLTATGAATLAGSPRADLPPATLDIVEPNSTAVQRFLRRDGLAAYEPPTLTTLLTLFDHQRPGFAFFDVGANMGLYAALCAALFDARHVHAFEPTPSTARIARRIAKANDLGVDVFELALSDRTGTAELHLSAVSDGSNSLVTGFKESTKSVTVPTCRLDEHVRATGVVPDVVKIDVETFEPAVLAGATETLTGARPHIVIEVLHRHGRDHGIELTAAMRGFGYHYYALDATPTWQAEPVISGRSTGAHHDWLLAPSPLPEEFASSWQHWHDAVATCGPERNSRVPIARSVLAATRRGGPSEVIATARRYLAARARERHRTPS